MSWNSYINSHKGISPLQSQDVDDTVFFSARNHFLEGLNTRLRAVWDDVSEFVRAANIAIQCRLKIDSDLYHEIMISIHYRLVNLHFEIGDMNETIRLGLLAFVSAGFLQWRGVETRYEHLVQRLEAVLSFFGHESRATPTQHTVWLYITIAISTLPENDRIYFKPAMTRALSSIKIKLWNEAKQLLKSVIWLDHIFDPSARQLVEGILNSV
ncbi:hypothetical protein F5Y06DRAFT_279140 [Hypoxylon sp. FL0890]|nr:hypothetical protein F5Y06DRAFT_279140 [Hypoxylon sp. FL0890]